MTAKTKGTKGDVPSPFATVLPKELKVGKDTLLLRLDFYGECIVMQDLERKGGAYRIVSAHDLAHRLASELSFASGLLPENTLWWANNSAGPVVAIWVPPGVRRLALQTEALKEPRRYDVPLPGLIFLCRPGHPPHVYAATSRPVSPKERVYKAPLANVYDDGRTCPGNHQYPANIADIPESFLCSFFSEAANLGGRSKKHPDSVLKIWKELDGKKEYPLSDLAQHGTVADLMAQRL